MTRSDVTAISLVTDKTRDEVCQSVVPSIARALSTGQVSYKRMPVTRDHIDWILNDTNSLTVAIDEVGYTSVIAVVARGPDTQNRAARLAHVAADLCGDFGVHTVFWNGSRRPLPVADFLAAGDSILDHGAAHARIIPRTTKASATSRALQHHQMAEAKNRMMSAVRKQMNGVTLQEIEQLKLEERRAKSAPMRLAAWAISFTTALIAAPLAIPLIAHNLVRGEDVRSGAMALGVAGLYAVLAQSGMAPGLAGML